jgi:hypothetical protein
MKRIINSSCTLALNDFLSCFTMKWKESRKKMYHVKIFSVDQLKSQISTMQYANVVIYLKIKFTNCWVKFTADTSQGSGHIGGWSDWKCQKQGDFCFKSRTCHSTADFNCSKMSEVAVTNCPCVAGIKLFVNFWRRHYWHNFLVQCFLFIYVFWSRLVSTFRRILRIYSCLLILYYLLNI